MDSRIREIEQWVAEAKHDLGSCGPEEYYRKLFLLDAEIRAAIKQSGCLPEAASPQRQAKRVRRFSNPSLALTGAIGVLFLAATTVYLNYPLAPSAPMMATAAQPAAAGSTYDPRDDRGHLPNPASLSEGEELIPETVLLAGLVQQDQAEPTAQPAMDDAAKAATPPLQLASVKPAQPKTLPAVKQPGATKPAAGHAPAVVILAANTGTAKAQPMANNRPSGTSSDFGAFNGATVSRFTHFPEGEGKDDDTVNRAKEQTNKVAKAAKGSKGTAGHDIVVTDPADNVDNSGDKDEKVDKLDPEALKDKLEKRFNH
jgi:hypothetical protein